jgi:hypothetical protein
VNAIEQAIQIFNIHFISDLCSTDINFPVQLRDHLTTQAVITVNLMHASQINTSKSAYHQLYGHKYDWNAHPMAPSGSRGIVYEDPTSRDSWGAHDEDMGYIFPALGHYMLFYWCVQETGGLRLSGMFGVFPQHCLLPDFSPYQHTNEVYDELCNSIDTMSSASKRKLLKKMKTTLQKSAIRERVAPV